MYLFNNLIFTKKNSNDEKCNDYFSSSVVGIRFL